MNNNTKSSKIVGAAIVTGVLALAACSSVPKPTAELASARTTIDTARQSGAPEFSAAEFAQAREALQSAERAAEREDNVAARRYAQQAIASAELAHAQAELAKTERAATEVEAGLSVLRRELK